MSKRTKVINTTHDDLDTIYGLFESAIAYQRKNTYPVWKGYDKIALIKDIEEGNQYKITMGKDIAMLFSVCYSNPLIWGERENGNALYLHRIVVNPAYKGNKLFAMVLAWSIFHGRLNKIPFIRMDTWADNPIMINYYKSFGFYFVDECITPDSEELAVQNRNLKVALLEYKIP
ncbi:MAG: GNAT family N-acetyltransferase, partial [Cyclobacteriaceae bacterium]|nr:GNAT family N-acetyltransferase [Cyclobacteriaceae bacterium]